MPVGLYKRTKHVLVACGQPMVYFLLVQDSGNNVLFGII